MPDRIFEGKILLMITHHGDQNFFGKRQVLFLEAPESNAGPLRKMSDGIDQRMILTPANSGDSAGSCVEGLANPMTRRFNIGDTTKAASKLAQILRRMTDLNRPVAMQNSMAISLVACDGSRKFHIT